MQTQLNASFNAYLLKKFDDMSSVIGHKNKSNTKIAILFIHYFKRIAHLATLASLPCGPLDIFTNIQIHTI